MLIEYVPKLNLDIKTKQLKHKKLTIQERKKNMKIFAESVTLAALLHNVVSIASATTRHVEKFGGQNVRPFPFFQFLNVS